MQDSAGAQRSPDRVSITEGKSTGLGGTARTQPAARSPLVHSPNAYSSPVCCLVAGAALGQHLLPSQTRQQEAAQKRAAGGRPGT